MGCKIGPRRRVTAQERNPRWDWHSRVVLIGGGGGARVGARTYREASALQVLTPQGGRACHFPVGAHTASSQQDVCVVHIDEHVDFGFDSQRHNGPVISIVVC